MASYVFLMQFWNETKSLTEADLHRMVQISEIGGALTIIACVMSFSLLCLLPIRSDGLFITGNQCLVLMAAQLSFIGSENTGYPNPVMCDIAAGLIQYFFLCLHFSSLAFAVHLGSKFGPMSLTAFRRRGFYLTCIWLLPFIVVMVTAIPRQNFVGPGTRCWLSYENNKRLFFLVPLGLLILANICMYVLIIRYTAYAGQKKALKKKTIVRHMVQTSLSLIPALGLHWALGFSITFDGPVFLQYLFVVLASAHGMLLLIFHVLTSGQVQKSLCEKIAVNVSDASSAFVTEPVTVDSNLEMPMEVKQE
ncbi:adhesion G protein-coupled receptor L4-like [Mya arenaria]|uniref:adhesion G protein-coupled receptor L4-like n=1 Tax=Mya arenaria TaxID=6604 RepID=UPI0022E97CFA|nr:adhesion G protein-coupled receptor L4-like [Mya arenaria]